MGGRLNFHPPDKMVELVIESHPAEMHSRRLIF